MQISRTMYVIAAWLFVVGVTVQVFFAGMSVVAGQWGWANHVNLGHALSLSLLVMVVTVFTGQYPITMKRLTLVLLGVYILQADVLIFLRVSAPVLSALHPVLALIDFALGTLLIARAREMRHESVDAVAAEAA